MHVTGDLGFSSLVLVVSFAFPVIVLIIRRKWRLAVARKEEITRLLILASEEAARAELEASYGYNYAAVSVPQYHQCVVCFCPTNARCSKCKAVRYCSGKCQFIHWRQGHKDECRPPSTIQGTKDEDINSTNENRREKEQSEVYDDRFLEVRQPAKPVEISSDESTIFDAGSSPKVPLRKDDEVKVEFHADGEGSSSNYESSERSFSGFSISHTSSESSDDVSVCESFSSVEFEKLDGPLSAGTPLDKLETASSVKDPEQTMPLSPKFNSLVDSVNNVSNLKNLSQIKPGSVKPGTGGEGQSTSTSSSGLRVRRVYEGSNVENFTPSSSFWGRALESTLDACDGSSPSNSPLPSLKFSSSPSVSTKDFEVNGIVTDDALPATSGRPTDGVGLSKNSNVDPTEIRNFPCLNCKSTRYTVNKTNVGSHVPKSQEVKSSMSFSSCVPAPSKTRDSISTDASHVSSLQSLSSDTKIHVINDNVDSSHCVGMHSLQSVRSGRIGDTEANSAMSSWVESSSNDRNGLKGFTLSKQYPVGVGSETSGRYSDKGLFSYEFFVKLYNWNKVELQPCGLINCGNSCYANAVLQCLVFTPPLTAYFLQGLHSKECAKKGWCFNCELENLILKAKERKSPLSPIGILSQLQNIGSQLGHGREEDAHEFLRYAIDTMQSVCLKEATVKASGPLEEETTLIGLTFGGYLRSKIKCMKCHGKSERQERMMDLTVEIEGDIGSLEEALRQFSGTEILDGENKYQCGRCKSYEKAKKKLTILEAPNVLTIALKRFQSGKFGKLNKSIRFPEILDLAPYMSGTSDKSPIYRLYGVVVHLDVMNAAFSGHYVCYVKSIQNKWFEIDDSTVTAVEREKVLTKGAYMLLYARCSPRAPRLIRNRISHDLRSKVIPSWVPGKSTTSKLRSPSAPSNVVQFYPSSVPTDSQASIESLYSRFHKLQRILEEDSSSDSSSLISSNSDEGSCSTDSTRDSSSTDDISDIICGDSGCGWNSPWRNSSDSDTSSPLYSRHSPLANSDQCSPGCSETSRTQAHHSASGSGCEGLGERSSSGSNRKVDLEGRGSDAFLHSYTTKQCRKLGGSSCRETDSERVGLVSPFNVVKSGVIPRKTTEGSTE